MSHVTADTITDEQIRALRANPEDHATFRDCLVALGDKRAPKGEKRAARERCAVLLNDRIKQRCPGREHGKHVADVCEGSCCTSCGGPIDENEECRC